MEHYTRLTKKEIEHIVAEFGVADVSAFKLLSGGSENTNYFVASEGGRYVLSVCEQKTVDQATKLTSLLVHLNNHDFETSEIVYTINREPITIWQNKPVILKRFIEGDIQQSLPPKLLHLIGKQLGKLHKIPAPDYLPRGLDYGKEKFSNVEQYAAGSEFNKWLKEVSIYLLPYFALDLPKAFIHSDLFWSNVIIDEAANTAVIMDFEEAAYYYRVFDIGMMIIGICGEGETVNLKKAAFLLTGYQSETQLLEEELRSLKAFTVYAGAAMTFWRHQNFNHIKPDPKMFDHYLGLKCLTDYMMLQADDCFVTSATGA